MIELVHWGIAFALGFGCAAMPPFTEVPIYFQVYGVRYVLLDTPTPRYAPDVSCVGTEGTEVCRGVVRRAARSRRAR